VHRTFEDDLWRVGGTGEVLLGRGSVRAGVSGGAHHTAGGTYTSGGGRFVLAGDWGAAELHADVWDTPLGGEVTGGLAFSIPLSGWSLRGFVGKTEPDPLTLAQPGSGGGGVILGVNVFSSESAARAGGPYRILAGTQSGARVRMDVTAPGEAHSVALVGDFTLWDPVPMRRAGNRWIVELDVPQGTHH
jgi:hypothetical protein